MPGRTNLNVTRLTIFEQNMSYFPSGFEKFLPNLIAIWIARSKLISIASTDLRPFPNLVEAQFPFNVIETVPGDLFSMNTKVLYVHFGWNKVSKVGKNLLQPLTSVYYAMFGSNVCVDSEALNTAQIPVLQDLLNKNCQ